MMCGRSRRHAHNYEVGLEFDCLVGVCDIVDDWDRRRAEAGGVESTSIGPAELVGGCSITNAPCIGDESVNGSGYC